MRKRIIIRFYVKKKVEYGQCIRLAGAVPGLGAWNPDQGIEMVWNQDDWWMGEYYCEGGFSSSISKNSFKLENGFGMKLATTTLDGNSNRRSSSPDIAMMDDVVSASLHNLNSSTSSTTSAYHISNQQQQQSISPILKGVSPQFIDLEYKYVVYRDYIKEWESANNHKISMMVWCNGNPSTNSIYDDEDDEILIEIRDEWDGGNAVCPTLDFQASTPSFSLLLNPQLSSSSSSSSLNNHNSNNNIMLSSSFNNGNWDNSSNFSTCSNSSSYDDSTDSILLNSSFNNNNNILQQQQLLQKQQQQILLQQSTLFNSHFITSLNSNPQPTNVYKFLHPMDPHPVPSYPSQICTFIVTDQGNSDAHNVLLVSHFFGSDLATSIEMTPIKQVGIPYTLWIGQLYTPQPIKFDYKYVVTSNNNAGIYWEKVSRIFSPSAIGPRLLINNDGALQVSDASESWIKTGLVGLNEIDNNCALTSIIQLLYHIHPLKNIILELRGRIGFPFTQCLSNIFTSMEMGSQTTDINPLQHKIGNSADSAEILNIIITSLIDEITTISRNYNQELNINQIFNGELTQTYLCVDKQGNVQSAKTQNENFVNIILPVKGFASLEESFKFYRHSRDVRETHSFESIVSFEKIPEIFIIQLDRTDYQQKQNNSGNNNNNNNQTNTGGKIFKISDRFTFPKKFIPINNDRYRIKGIICHTGDQYDANSGGHYFLYVRRRKQWYRCDGSNISFVSHREAYYNSFGGVEQQQACLLIYEKMFDKVNQNNTNNSQTW